MIPGHDWISRDTDCAGPFSFGGGCISPFDLRSMTVSLFAVAIKR
jgi:hypothetical protein